MKFMKRTQVYKAANVVFDPGLVAPEFGISAYSYGWWKFVALIKGRVIFNAYRYSQSTCKHQLKVRRLMDQLGIRIDLVIHSKASLKHFTTIKQLKDAEKKWQAEQLAYAEAKRIKRNAKARQRRAELKERNMQREEQRPHLSLIGGI